MPPTRRSFLMTSAALLAVGCGQNSSQPSQPGSDLEPSEPSGKGGPRYDPSMWVDAAAFSPDGKRVLTRYSLDKVGKARPRYPSLTLWDTTTGKEIWTRKLADLDVSHFAFLPDGKGILVRSGDYLKMLDPANGKVVRTFEKDDKPISCLAVSPDGKLALTGGGHLNDGRESSGLKLWNLATGQAVRRLGSGIFLALTFSHDGRLVLAKCRSSGGAAVQLWDMADAKVIRTFDSEDGWGGPIAFSSDGKLGVSGRFKADTNEFVLWDTATGKPVRSFPWDSPSVVTLTPDAKGLLSGSLSKQTLALWEIATGKQRWSERIGGLRSVAFSPNAKLAFTATGHSEGPEDLDHRLKLTVWDAVEGKRLRQLGNTRH